MLSLMAVSAHTGAAVGATAAAVAAQFGVAGAADDIVGSPTGWGRWTATLDATSSFLSATSKGLKTAISRSPDLATNNQS
jgi:hypothetical protein